MVPPRDGIVTSVAGDKTMVVYPDIEHLGQVDGACRISLAIPPSKSWTLTCHRPSQSAFYQDLHCRSRSVTKKQRRPWRYEEAYSWGSEYESEDCDGFRKVSEVLLCQVQDSPGLDVMMTVFRIL